MSNARKEVERAIRDKLEIPIVLENSSVCENTETVNISMGGICIFTQQLSEVDIGSEINITIGSSTSPIFKKIPATLVWLDSGGISEKRSSGFRYSSAETIGLVSTSLNILHSITQEHEIQKNLYDQLLYIMKQTHTLKDVYRAILEAVNKLCKPESSIFKIYDPSNEGLISCESCNLNDKEIGEKCINISDCPSELSLREKKPFKSDLTKDHLCFSEDYFDSIGDPEDYSLWNIPIIGNDDELIGTVCCILKSDNNIPDKITKDLESFVSASIRFIENALDKELIQKTLMVTKTKELIKSEKFLNKLADSIREVMSSESCSIFFIDEINKEKLKLVGSTINKWEKLSEVTYDLSDTSYKKHLTSIVAVEKKSIICNDTVDWHNKHQSKEHFVDIDQGKGKTYIGVPLITENNQVKGVIRCTNKGNHFDKEALTNCFSRYDIAILEHLSGISELLYGLFDSYNDMIRFLTVASHEIGNPLHFFEGALHSLSKSLRTNEKNNYILNRLDALESSSNLLNVLNANWTVMLKDQATSNRLPYDLYGDVITKVVGMLRPRCRHYKIEIEYDDIKNIPGSLYIDPLAFKQVFYNILINSVKYRGESQEPIKIISKSLQDRIMISVFDNGIGIPEEDKEIIFNFRQRGSNVDGDNQRGHGIGLYVCRRILNLYGARIYVANHQKPTLFVIELPKNLLDSDWFKNGIPQLKELKFIRKGRC